MIANLDSTPQGPRLGQAAILTTDRCWTWHEIHSASVRLARLIRAGTPVCNLCETRVGFLVAWLAALRNRSPMLLPPSGSDSDLERVLAETPNATIVVDREALLAPFSKGRTRAIVLDQEILADPLDPSNLAWTPDGRYLAVCLFTSGSTGQPRAQWRTLDQLLQGARALVECLEMTFAKRVADSAVVVSSVAPQHMFGFETSVMLPILTGVPVFDARPLLPLDISTLFSRCRRPAVWITTPMHVRALARAKESVANCDFALSSTMPLDRGLAAQVEPLIGAPIIEIYGSTETGALALRRTTQNLRWKPISGVVVDNTGDATNVTGLHFPSPQEVSDVIEVAADGMFELVGRHSDLVKVGGRRASLAGLNLIAQQLPGLEDGVFYLPPGDVGTVRTVFFHQGALDRDAAESWMRKHIDPVFLPRTWIQVDRLPRDSNGKLRRTSLDKLWETRSQHDPANECLLKFVFSFPADHPAFPGHFPGNPIVPGVLLLDQLIHEVAMRTEREVTHFPWVKFKTSLRPGEAARACIRVRESTGTFSVHVDDSGESRLIVEGAVVLQETSVEARS